LAIRLRRAAKMTQSAIAVSVILMASTASTVSRVTSSLVTQ
jgi:hypothetical protein